jgi:DNA repair protein RecO (recombination protein O)
VNQIRSKAIILSRTDFGEADRILTLLTPEAGKLRLMAKGVRKIKSRLAGGIELFSVSDITFIRGRGDIGTLISARLDRHYGEIVRQIDRVQLGYEVIKKVNKATEDAPEAAYFDLLDCCFSALNTPTINAQLIDVWFQAQLLILAGHTPNLRTTANNLPLTADRLYGFDDATMCFAGSPNGPYSANHIKMIRLLFGPHQPAAINTIGNLPSVLPTIAPLIMAMLNSSLRV